MLVLLLSLFACDRESFYSDASLYENIKDTYTDCDANEIWHDPRSQIHSQSSFAHLICFSEFPLLLHVQ